MGTAYLSLGSNLEPERHLRSAARALCERFGEVAFSPVFRSAAVGFPGPHFLNCAARLYTDLDPIALDQWLHALEDRHGRRRDVPRLSSRTLDADLVLYDTRVLHGPGNLELPRPELAEQAFVLAPMVELAPQLVHPTLQVTLEYLLERLGPSASLHRTQIALECG